MLKFSKLSTLIIVILFSSISLYSYDFRYLKDIKVGNEPVAVFYDSNSSLFHIFCKGTDKDFENDFEPDSGDVLPSWWILKLDNNSEVKEIIKVKDFEFNSIPFPFRPAFVAKERAIYINHFDGITKYNLDTYEQIGEKIEIFGVNALDYLSGHLLISQTNYGASIDTILVYSIAQNKVINKYPVGLNLAQAKMFQPSNPDYKGIVAISTGNFGSDSSMLHTATFGHFEQPIFNDRIVGNTANYIDIVDNKFAIIPVMISNKLMLFSLNDDGYFTSIDLGDEPTWDGPSFSKFVKINSNENNTETEYLIITTTYSGNLEIYQFSNKEFPEGSNERSLEHLKTINLQNKGEALDFSPISENGTIQLIVANSLKADYSPNNTVSLINLEDIINSVNNDNEALNFVLTNDEIRFTGKMEFKSVFSIFDTNGNLVRTTENSNSISTLNLPSGFYFAKFYNGSKSYLHKFNSVK